MEDLLKNIYNQTSITELAIAIGLVYIPFKVEEFIHFIIDDTWENLELKGRTRHITTALRKYLPENYVEAVAILDKVVKNYSEVFGFVFPDFIEVYGQDEVY